MLVHGDLTEQILGICIDIHRALGPGLLESAYVRCVAHELGLRRIPHRAEVRIPVRYQGLELDCGYRVDLLVAERVILEIKAVERLLEVHDAQLLTYLKMADVPVGLLINFNVPLLPHGGIRRLVHTSTAKPEPR